jgi:predicted naringenin-chalcone synthase
LKEILKNNADNQGRNNIFAAAFGPGLTVETMQLSQ